MKTGAIEAKKTRESAGYFSESRELEASQPRNSKAVTSSPSLGIHINDTVRTILGSVRSAGLTGQNISFNSTCT